MTESINSVTEAGIRTVNERLEFVPLQEQESFIQKGIDLGRQFAGALVYDVVGHTG